MDYYRMYDDTSYPDRWYLGDVSVEDNYIFTNGQPVDAASLKDLTIEMDQEGIALDLTETDTLWVPIISEALAECLYEYVDDIQLIPVSVPDRSNRYYILVIKNAINCVDERRSDFDLYAADDEVRPDLAGEYARFRALYIDPSTVNNHIFRIAKYDLYMIISGEIKEKLEKASLIGVKFDLVS